MTATLFLRDGDGTLYVLEIVSGQIMEAGPR